MTDHIERGATDHIERGAKVRFHPIIGGNHDGNVYVVRHVWDSHPGFREPLVFLEGKSGAVSMEAVSLYRPLTA